MDSFFDPMRRTMDREMLKFSAGHAMFCPLCEKVADARRWAMFTTAKGEEVGMCTTCWDGIRKDHPLPPGSSLVDGREVFGQSKRKPAAPKGREAV